MVKRKNEIVVAGRKIGSSYPPLVIAEVGINHEGNLKKAIKMVDDAHKAGAECVKFQSHVVEDEMVPVAKKIAPGHTTENIWDIMVRCSLSETEALKIKKYVEKKGMIYLCTPFSRAAADRLKKFKAKRTDLALIKKDLKLIKMGLALGAKNLKKCKTK